MKIMLTPHDEKIVHAIISQYPYTFYVYGSRATGKAKKFSDLDLCIAEDVHISTIGNLLEQFDNSNLSIKVDIVCWNKLTPDFQKQISNDLVLLQKKKI